MAKASQAVILENEFYIIKAPNGKVLEVKNFNTENGASSDRQLMFITPVWRMTWWE